MQQNYLDFEQPIAELQAKIEELRLMDHDTEMNIQEELARLSAKSRTLTERIFAKLTPWQIVQLARHPKRPHTSDYIEHLFTDYDTLQGDRHFSAGHTIIGGLARFHDQPVMVIGHQKGRNTKENVLHNFGMPKPEDYRKALRLMRLAERFSIPVICLIDTPGAYPGIDAEERNQSEAIARNLYEMADLRVPILCVVIGEGGSGGALAIGVGDWVGMLQYSIYSVISPEGCASILWKSAERAADAAQALGVNAERLHQLKLIDQVIEEPLGGAHRDLPLMVRHLDQALWEAYQQIKQKTIEQCIQARQSKWLNYGLALS